MARHTSPKETSINKNQGTTKTDYSPFLSASEDGKIWWRLEDAIKLGAGYLPLCDDESNLIPVLRAKNNQVRANERTLLSEFSQDHYTETHPRFLMRDDGRYVEAQEFLNWLSKWCDKDSHSFPYELARAVRNTTASTATSTQLSFISLTATLEDWFDKPMADLPDKQRKLVETDFAPMPWDNLSSEQRRSVALQMDYQHDPATEQERQFWWDFFLRKDALKIQIQQWDTVPSPTASDLALRETRLKELRQELDRMDQHERQARGDNYPQQKRPDRHVDELSGSPKAPIQYIAYPKAMKLLSERLDATPEELAAWLFFGPKLGGLTAYLNANELNPPPKFNYGYHTGSSTSDYIAPLMSCWFIADDIANFKPTERYITGKALIERWGEQPSIHPQVYILAKIRESRLIDCHPIYGGTEASFSDIGVLPPLETGLFALSQIEQIEAEDFSIATEPKNETASQRRERITARVREEKTKGTRAFLQVIAKEEGLSTSRIKQIIKGDVPAKKGKLNNSPWEGLLASTRQTSSKKSNT